MQLFAALHDDPSLIAETLVRPRLAERLARNWFAYDDRIHADTKRRAMQAWELGMSGGEMKALAGRYSERRLTHAPASPAIAAIEVAAASEGEEVALDDDEFRSVIAKLERSVGASIESVPLRTWSRLEETPDGWTSTSVLDYDGDTLRTATASWPKATFDSWWSARRASFARPIETAPKRYRVTAPFFIACAGDTWRGKTADENVPDPRRRPTAVWTGAEMIVWGGDNSSTMGTGARYDPATDTWRSVSMDGAPSARAGHTAVWTGTQMIVWGGTGSSSPSSGGRYDPVSDTWAPTSTGSFVPSARSGHTAVWTGSRMLVWGGSSGGTRLNTGGGYDPATDTWNPISTAGAVPSARTEHAAVWTGSRMLVWGGSIGTLSYSGDGGSYDPASDAWTAIPAGGGSPSARRFHTAVWTGSEMVVWGGATSTSKNDGGRYNPVSQAWQATSTGAGNPAPRSQHTAIWTGTAMLVWGGDVSDPDAGGRYDPAANAWSSLGTSGVPMSRRLHAVVWTGDEMIVWGGERGSSRLNTGGRYSPVSNAWVPTTTGVTVPVGRLWHSAVWTGAEMIVWGGSNQAQSVTFKDGGRYDPATDTWQPTSLGPGSPDGRRGHTAVWTGNEMIVWGGVGASFFDKKGDGARYDPATDSWSPMAPFAWDPYGPRAFHTVVWTGTEMIVWGGLSNVEQATGGQYNLSTDTWTIIAATNLNWRTGHTAVWTGSEMIIWGGSGNAGVSYSDGSRFDPSTGLWHPTSNGAGTPSQRSDHTANWTGAEMIVWGGDGAGATGARYDPTLNSWTPTSLSGVPEARSAHSAVWTGSEMIVWGGSGPKNSGGRYSPATDSWLSTSIEGAPRKRLRHTAVWTGTSMVVWGGEPETGTGGAYCTCTAGPAQYRDLDFDGFGDPLHPSICDNTPGYVSDATDCDDQNSDVYPGAPALCDGLGNDCLAPDWPQPEPSDGTDLDADGALTCAGDCDDADASTYPGAPQACDGRNNDCDDPTWPTVPAPEASTRTLTATPLAQTAPIRIRRSTPVPSTRAAVRTRTATAWTGREAMPTSMKGPHRATTAQLPATRDSKTRTPTGSATPATTVDRPATRVRPTWMQTARATPAIWTTARSSSSASSAIESTGSPRKATAGSTCTKATWQSCGRAVSTPRSPDRTRSHGECVAFRIRPSAARSFRSRGRFSSRW